MTDSNAYFEALRSTEYPALDEQNHVYLDFTGGNLCPKSILEKHVKLLAENVLGNPHSTNPTSQLATKLVEEVRQQILDFFKASDYECIFTSNASGALKIVGESYPFSDSSSFVLTSDNHNSVNGIREFCNGKRGRTVYIPMNHEDLSLNEETLKGALNAASPETNNLFAFPAQSNVSGVKHNLDWISYAQERGFDVLLDAAAYVPTSKLDLSQYKPDFVSMSFYKIFGYPTGIGCLLIKKSTFNKLQKPWFAGGTVTLVSAVTQNKFLASGHERFEDGTLNYANIPSIKFGLDYINSIGIERINARVKELIHYLYDHLLELKYPNGNPLVKIFGPSNFDQRGGNIILNFFDDQRNLIPFASIENLANERTISIRSGCFCNPGIDEANNCISQEEMSNYFASKTAGDYYDLIAFTGKIRGAIRVSVGIATNHADLDRFVEFAKSILELEIKKANFVLV